MIPSKELTLSDPKAKAYKVKENYILLIWNDIPYFIYEHDKWVGRSSDFRKHFLGQDFWPKDCYASVPLGDGIKGDPREKYLFRNDTVTIKVFDFHDRNKSSEIVVGLKPEE